MTSCMVLWPLPVCGNHGKCVTAELPDNTTGAVDKFCECEAGWSQSLELNFFINSEDELKTSVCTHNESLVQVLYTFIILLAVGIIFYQFLFIDNHRKFYRQVPSIFLSLVVISLALWRILDEGALIGVNPGFTILCMLMGVSSQISSYVFMTKYFKYMSKEVRISYQSAANHNGTMHRIKEGRHFYIYIVIASSLSFMFIVVITFLDYDNKHISSILLRSMLVMQILRSLYEFIFFYISFKNLQISLEDMLSLTNAGNNVQKVANEDFTGWIEKRIPKINRMRRRLLLISSIESFLWMVTLSWDLLFLSWGSYVFPVNIILVHGYKVTVIKAKRNAFRMGTLSRANVSSFATSSGRFDSMLSRATMQLTLPRLRSRTSTAKLNARHSEI